MLQAVSKAALGKLHCSETRRSGRQLWAVCHRIQWPMRASMLQSCGRLRTYRADGLHKLVSLDGLAPHALTNRPVAHCRQTDHVERSYMGVIYDTD